MKLPFNKDVKRIIRAAYPDYNGRKIQLAEFNPSMKMNSFWDEGNRTYYTFVQVDTLKTYELHSNHPFFEPNQPKELNVLPPGVVIVAHHIYGAGTNSITIYARADEMPKFLPSPIKEVA